MKAKRLFEDERYATIFNKIIELYDTSHVHRLRLVPRSFLRTARSVIARSQKDQGKAEPRTRTAHHLLKLCHA